MPITVVSTRTPAALVVGVVSAVKVQRLAAPATPRQEPGWCEWGQRAFGEGYSHGDNPLG
jgi:hypothetical protein